MQGPTTYRHLKMSIILQTLPSTHHQLDDARACTADPKLKKQKLQNQINMFLAEFCVELSPKQVLSILGYVIHYECPVWYVRYNSIDVTKFEDINRIIAERDKTVD